MKYQVTPYSCGAAAIVNALRCFGKKVTEHQVKEFSNTTKELGTDEKGLISALQGLGHDGEFLVLSKKDDFIEVLKKNILNGNPVIVGTQNLQHWTTVIGMVGDMFIMFDPSNSVRNVRENGTIILSAKQITRACKTNSGQFQTIICTK